jgi:hypothetical protein
MNFINKNVVFLYLILTIQKFKLKLKINIFLKILSITFIVEFSTIKFIVEFSTINPDFEKTEDKGQSIRRKRLTL